MNGEVLWDRIIEVLSVSGEEVQTTTGLWFIAASQNGRVCVDKALKNTPSSELSKKRSISKKDFLLVYTYYDRWINGETGTRYEVSRKSRNTAYIFALIDMFRNT